MDPIKRDVSQPFSTGMPKAKVCERLKKKSAEICTIKYRECLASCGDGGVVDDEPPRWALSRSQWIA
jgi:hypothetical protein